MAEEFTTIWCVKDKTGESFIGDWTTGTPVSSLDKAVYFSIPTPVDEDTACDLGEHIAGLIESTGCTNWCIEVWNEDYTVKYAEIQINSVGMAIAITEKTPATLARHIRKIAKEYLSDYIYAATSKLILKAAKGIAAPTEDGAATIEKAVTEEDKVKTLIDEICKNTKADIVKPKETLAEYVCEDNLKTELEEIKDFFENEKTYTDAGIRIPKGILFKGLPGTGKTYAARCIAGSVECYFMTCTASALQGMYIGSGAENIRNVFRGAKELRRCSGKGVIVFIDEIDSFGNRESHGGSTSGEEDRTLNQLLAEMSGFEDSEGIMVLAATNFPERLDDALMRSGRFSRQITIDPPNEHARRMLCEHYFGKVKLPLKDIDYDDITQLTPGFTPADIQELANESGILALRAKSKSIEKDNVDEAINKTITKDVRKPDKAEILKIVALHECGHVLAEFLYNDKFSLKVTNYAYGDAGGFTQPNKEISGLISKEKYVAKIKMLLGGRVAEMSKRQCTTGASDDLRRAVALIKNYFTIYHFEEYSPKDIDDIVQCKLTEIQEEMIKDFEEPEKSKTLTELTKALCYKRTLHASDIAAIITKELGI